MTTLPDFQSVSQHSLPGMLVAVPPAPLARRKPRAPLPETFEVTGKMRTWAEQHGIPYDMMMFETEMFVLHAEANGRILKNWEAGWRMWLLKSLQYMQRQGVSHLRGQRQHPSTAAQRSDDVAAAVFSRGETIKATAR